MVNISTIHRQQTEEAQVKEILENPYKEIVWLGKKYKSLHSLCLAKNIPYQTVVSRLKSKSHTTLTEAIINTQYYNDKNNILRLHKSGQFTIGEIATALNISRRKVEYTLD